MKNKYLKIMVYEPYRAALKRLNAPINKYDFWQKTARTLGLSKQALLRLDWIIYYYKKSDKNASLTARHFGIPRSQWYYWFSRFDENNLRTLENESTAPQKTRQKEYTSLQYSRVVKLRQEFIKYGKMKLLEKYRIKHPDDQTISSWKIQCIIQTSGIYYKPAKNSKTQIKRQKANHKKRITELKTKPRTGYLICLDTIVKYLHGQKRYILTAIDKYSKLAFARMYQKHSSFNARDFLYRLNYLLKGEIENILTDNGSEFMKYFDRACSELDLQRYFSRVRTPQDNAVCERFNRTLKEEFISLGNMTEDVVLFNQRLSNWLIEYNFYRPHQSLDYHSPVNFIQKYSKVSERYSSNTLV